MAQWHKKSFKIPVILAILLIALIFALAFFIGKQVQKNKTNAQIYTIVNSIKPVRENNFNYKYIFPLLAYDFTQANQYLKDENLDKQLDAQVAWEIKTGNAQGISVYVRNFKDNKWAGTDEDALYHPGSILKVLIMMAYFREAELDPNVLNKNLIYSKDTAKESTSLNYSLPSSLTVGKSYTVTELIEQMIANSDNGAESLLIDNVDHNILNSAYTDLNIPNPDSAPGDYTISPRQYAGFLRILYNSTYLTEIYSEQALAIMSKSTYKDGIVAGLPANIQVAQKYGERIDTDSKNQVQAVELHNCGIVYAPNNPYSLCIMTKGQDEKKLATSIKDISALIYGVIGK